MELHQSRTPGPATLAAIRDLMGVAFGDRFDDHDWKHARGGLHVWIQDGDSVICHASLIGRMLWIDGHPVRAAYVEAVATAPEYRRRGHAGRAMAVIESHRAHVDVLALSASRLAIDFYLRRGWRQWRGPTAVRRPTGEVPTPDDDGGVYVYQPTGLDLDAPIACDDRSGDVW